MTRRRRLLYGWCTIALATTMVAAGCSSTELETGGAVSASVAQCLGQAASMTDDAKLSLASGESVEVPRTNLEFVTEFFKS